MTGWWLNLVSLLIGVVVGYLLDLTKGWLSARRERHNVVWRLRAEGFLKTEAEAGVLRELLLGAQPFERVREELAALIARLERRVGEVSSYEYIQRPLRDLVHEAKTAFSTEKRWELRGEYDNWVASLKEHHRLLIAGLHRELNR